MSPIRSCRRGGQAGLASLRRGLLSLSLLLLASIGPKSAMAQTGSLKITLTGVIVLFHPSGQQVVVLAPKFFQSTMARNQAVVGDGINTFPIPYGIPLHHAYLFFPLSALDVSASSAPDFTFMYPLDRNQLYGVVIFAGEEAALTGVTMKSGAADQTGDLLQLGDMCTDTINIKLADAQKVAVRFIIDNAVLTERPIDPGAPQWAIRPAKENDQPRPPQSIAEAVTAEGTFPAAKGFDVQLKPLPQQAGKARSFHFRGTQVRLELGNATLEDIVGLTRTVPIGIYPEWVDVHVELIYSLMDSYHHDLPHVPWVAGGSSAVRTFFSKKPSGSNCPPVLAK
jgi:hypothetical protein